MNESHNFNSSPSLLEEDVLEKPKERIDHKTKEFALNLIDKLLYGYSNEIPKEIIHSDQIVDGGKDYKVRAAWFSTIEILLRGIVKKYLPKDFCDEALELLIRVKTIDTKETSNGKLVHITTKEEIEKGDELLKRARILLENQ